MHVIKFTIEIICFDSIKTEQQLANTVFMLIERMIQLPQEIQFQELFVFH